MPVPDTTKWEEIAQGFWTECKFPNCVGALDGKHIRLQKPVGSGSHYFNYKKYFSIVLMAVADADYKFVYVDVGSYGSSNDSGIFQRTTLCRLMEEGRLRLPRDRPWPGTRAPAYPYVFVGDEAFALSDHVMRPYPDRGLDASQLHFNVPILYHLTWNLFIQTFNMMTHVEQSNIFYQQSQQVELILILS
ncbi:uncharacterized protein [Hyperolius riggenbachi]|uniref:uncharacterized protein n=1 Tax=Hyperolius riggenbachi TaxID=752182 RepID=UPI0035A295EB